jgi:hypothetical protein
MEGLFTGGIGARWRYDFLLRREVFSNRVAQDHKKTRILSGSDSHSHRPRIIVPASNEIQFTVQQ